MIGFILRGLGFGGLGSSVMLFAGSALAVCAMCGIYKCSKCRLRDCGCIKSLFLWAGVDRFDDFEMMFLVHEASFVSKREKSSVVVRVQAGSQEVTTDRSRNGMYHQPLAVFVEQGTPHITVSLIGNDGSTLAVLKLVTVDIVENHMDIIDKVYIMKQKKKDLLNPRIKLSLSMDSILDEEKNLFADMNMSPETDMLIRKQKQIQAQSPAVSGSEKKEELSELELLAKSCAGPLEMFGSWGSILNKFVAVIGPPVEKKYRFCIWDTKQASETQEKPEMVIDVRKVLNVIPDPGRSDVFTLDYVDANKLKKKLTFRRIDRTRDVWVEVLHLLIKLVREAKKS